jgi:hypothetical protein
MTTTAKQTSNGGKRPASPPDRTTGMARIKEAEAYHVASVAHSAAFEGERLCNEIYRTASDGYLRDTHVNEAAETLADPATQRKIEEAACCLVVAIEHLCSLMADPPL